MQFNFPQTRLLKVGLSCFKLAKSKKLLMQINLTTLLILAACLQVSASVTAQITLREKNVPIEKVFKLIRQQSGYDLLCSADVIRNSGTVTVSVQNVSLNEALEACLKNKSLVYRVVDKTVIITRKETPASIAQATDPALLPPPIDVHGVVKDENGKPIPGVTVLVRGTAKMTTTNEFGEFNLAGVDDGSILFFTSVNMLSTEMKVTPKAVFQISMKTKITQLEDVSIEVSNGYQTLPRERVTGSFSVITAKDLEKIPAPNLIQRLEGLATGLQATIYSGDNSYVYQGLTQGINSTTRNIGVTDYAINVRGNTTLLGEKMPLIVVDGFPTEIDMKSINPSDIEQITILKDAAAASIWGARAANGVIVITTKKGKNLRAPSVNFSTSYTAYGKPRLNYLPLANSAQLINYEQEVVNKGLFLYNPFTTAPSTKYYVSEAVELTYKLKNNLIDSATYKSEIARLSGINGYDQLKQYLLQPASSQDYNLSVSGGNDTHSYFFSGSYSKEIPNAVGNSGDRFTVTANQTFKILKKATLSVNLRAAIFSYSNNGLGVGALANGANAYLPYNQIVDAAGNPQYYSYAYYKGRTDTLQSLRGYLNWGYSYLNELSASDKTINDNNYNGNINLTVPIVKGLTASGQFMVEKAYQAVKTWNGPDSYFSRNVVNTATSVNYTTGVLTYGIPKGGVLQQTFSNNSNYSARGQLDYANTIKGIHQINAVAGVEIRQTQQSQTTPSPIYGYNLQTGNGQSVLANYVNVNGNSITTTSIASGGQADKTRRFYSYYANAAYTLLGKYSLSASVRYDDYNNFGVDQKYRATPLWSTGAKWNISDEKFLQNTKWLNSLALRTTFGYNGNLSLGTYPFTTISLSSSSLTGLPTASIFSPANPTLRWEKTSLLNLGVDYSILKNRIRGSIEWYKKWGRDLLYSFPVDPTYGVSSLTLNNTSVNAQGFEASISGGILRNKDWDITSTFNFSYNKNEIVDARFTPSAVFYSSLIGGTITGYPTNALWVYRFAGLDNTGMTQIYDADKSTKLAPSKTPSGIDAMYYAGPTTAPYYGSFAQNIRYKQFSLYALFTYSYGAVFLRPTVTTYQSTRYTTMQYDLNRDIDKRWRQPGDEAFTNVPGISGTYAATSLFRYGSSDINVLDGSYIRFRELSLGYDLPKSIANRITAKLIRLSLAVRNLGLIWTKNKEGIDPDFVPAMASNTLKLPPSPSFTMSLNVNF
jgi:TonB-linked SusC/RagA family outer membrane protein